MPYKAKSNIRHGKAGKEYHIRVGDVVADDFFTKKEIKRNLGNGTIEMVESGVVTEVKGSENKQIPDISGMTPAEVREFLEKINDPVMIEKLIDQEQARPQVRKNVVQLLDRRAKELAGK